MTKLLHETIRAALERARIGQLGGLAFEVSPRTIRTLDQAQWSGSARWATHERHLDNALTEFLGRDPDSFQFEIYLSRFLGTEPLDDLALLWQYEREGTPLYLILGEKFYGKYRWVILSHSAAFESYDRAGNLASCTVELRLQEYLPS